MSNDKLNGADYLLVLFYLPDGNCAPIEGKTRITKMMFLFKKEIYSHLKMEKLTAEDKLPDFIAHNYGPFSRDVHEQLYLFQNIGFVELKEKKITDERENEHDMPDDEIVYDEEYSPVEVITPTIYEYKLSQTGKCYVEEKLINKFGDNQIKLLEEFKYRIVNMRLTDILGYVYRKYPDYTKNSLIKERILGNEY